MSSTQTETQTRPKSMKAPKSQYATKGLAPKKAQKAPKKSPAQAAGKAPRQFAGKKAAVMAAQAEAEKKEKNNKLTKVAVTNMALLGGAQSMTGEAHDDLAEFVDGLIPGIVEGASLAAIADRRTTILPRDIQKALAAHDFHVEITVSEKKSGKKDKEKN